MVKSHLELHCQIKSTLTLGELHLEESDVDQVPGEDYFLKHFTNIFKDDPKIRNHLSLCILCSGVSKISINQNPNLPLNYYNFLLVSAAHPEWPLILFL